MSGEQEERGLSTTDKQVINNYIDRAADILKLSGYPEAAELLRTMKIE